MLDLVRFYESQRVSGRSDRRDPNSVVPFAGLGRFALARKKMYLRLKSSDFDVQLRSNPEKSGDEPAVRVEVHSVPLAIHGWRQVVQMVRESVWTLGVVDRDDFGRIDLAVDQVSGEPRLGWGAEQLVAEGYARRLHLTGREQYRDPRELGIRTLTSETSKKLLPGTIGVQEWLSGRRYSGFTAGFGGSGTMLRMYDKLEQAKVASAQLRWDAEGLVRPDRNAGESVWRTEFEAVNVNRWFADLELVNPLNGQICRYSSIDKWLHHGLGPMWRYLTQEWARVVQLDRSRAERSQEEPFWARLQALAEEGEFRYHQRTREEVSRVDLAALLRQDLGLWKTILAAIGSGEDPGVVVRFFQDPRIQAMLTRGAAGRAEVAGCGRGYWSAADLVELVAPPDRLGEGAEVCQDTQHEPNGEAGADGGKVDAGEAVDPDHLRQ